jgi:hypothetical protein
MSAPPARADVLRNCRRVVEALFIITEANHLSRKKAMPTSSAAQQAHLANPSGEEFSFCLDSP